MAMGRRTRDEAERAIANCRPFQNSTGSMRGTRGSTRDLGWLSSHREHVKIKELLGRATYVVWSYDTPIGCVTEDDDGNVTKVYFDKSHSATTSQHQGILRVGFSDFESIGDGPWSRSNRPRRARASVPVNQAAVDRANAVTAGYAEAARREPTAAHVYAATARRRELADSPGYQNGLTERQQQTTLAQLLDPRYANPDWVPGRDVQADREAELRDIRRIKAEVQERGWRP